MNSNEIRVVKTVVNPDKEKGSLITVHLPKRHIETILHNFYVYFGIRPIPCPFKIGILENETVLLTNIVRPDFKHATLDSSVVMAIQDVCQGVVLTRSPGEWTFYTAAFLKLMDTPLDLTKTYWLVIHRGLESTQVRLVEKGSSGPLVIEDLGRSRPFHFYPKDAATLVEDLNPVIAKEVADMNRPHSPSSLRGTFRFKPKGFETGSLDVISPEGTWSRIDLPAVFNDYRNNAYHHSAEEDAGLTEEWRRLSDIEDLSEWGGIRFYRVATYDDYEVCHIHAPAPLGLRVILIPRTTQAVTGLLGSRSVLLQHNKPGRSQEYPNMDIRDIPDWILTQFIIGIPGAGAFSSKLPDELRSTPRAPL